MIQIRFLVVIVQYSDSILSILAIYPTSLSFFKISLACYHFESFSFVISPALAHAGIRKIKKGGRVTRSKNLRKLKLIAKAITMSQKGEEKQLKMKSKTQRVQSAKTLYD